MSLQDDLIGYRQQLEGLSKGVSVLRGSIGDLERELINTIDPSHRLILSRRLEEARREVDRLEGERGLIQGKIKELIERIRQAPRLQQVAIQHWDNTWDLKTASSFPEVHSFVLFPPMVEEDIDEVKRAYVASGYHNYAVQMPGVLRRRGWRAMLNVLYGPHPNRLAPRRRYLPLVTCHQFA